MRNRRSRWRRGSLAKEEGENGKYGKNGEEVRWGWQYGKEAGQEMRGGWGADIT
jgi:hypothetical protein